MKKIISISICIVVFLSLFNSLGIGQHYIYAESVQKSLNSNNLSEESSIGIFSTSVYPDDAVVKFGEKIHINYSFHDEAHPVLINIYINGEEQSEYIYKQSSWGGSFSYEPKEEGKYRFVVKPTDQEYYTNECTVTVYKDRIIFLPGTMGSELYHGEEQIWMPDSRGKQYIWSNINNLKMNTSGQSIENIGIGNSVKDYYSGIISFFKNSGYHVVDFAYDWRKGSTFNAQELKARIDIERAASPYSNYYIVAHSMGGIVATEYIRQGNGHLIKKLITLGTPFQGTPQAAYMFETGNITDDEYKNMAISSSIRSIEPNIPSLYELLPSKKYFTSQTNGYLQTQEYPESTGSRVKTTKFTNFNDTANFLKNSRSWSNDILFDKATNFHSTLDPVNTLKQVDSYYFVGDQKPTAGTLTFYTHSNPNIILSDVKNVQGDNTVPVSSATAGFMLDPSRTFYIQRSHIGLATSVDVQKQILNILKGRPNELVSDKIRRNKQETKTLKIKAECPVELHVYDSSGKHTGSTGPDNFESNIPDANYFTDGETKIALLNDVEDYKVRIVGTGYGELTFSIVWANEKDIENRTLRFDNVAVTPTSVFKADVNQNGQVILQIDQNGDGNFEGSINPTVELDLGGTQDETIPTLTSHVTGVKGVNEWYGKNVHYNLSGEDNASGIYKYFYNLNESEYKEYTEPLALPNTGIYNFKSYVRDKNRNDSEVLTETVKVDTTNPTVPVMTVDPTTWTNKFVTITLDGGTDADSGFQKYQYKINSNGEWKDYTAPFVIDSEGLYNVYARSVDNVFNLSAEVTGVAKVDKTNPPKPTMTVAPSKWTNQLVTITLSGGADTDKGFPNSGFQKYQYKIDSGEWKDYNTPIIIDTEGLFKITARSVDTASNLSEEVSGEAKIDRTNPPKPTLTVKPLKWTNEFVTVTLAGGTDTDKGFPNSGFQKYQYKIGHDGAWKDYTIPVIFDVDGLYNVFARSVDNAFNQSEEVVGDAKVDKVKPSTPNGFEILSYNYNQVKISWLPSTDNVGVTSYDIYQDSELINSTSNTEFTFSNLISDRSYTFTIVARDEATNSSFNGIFVVQTPKSLVAAGLYHNLQVKTNGHVLVWGGNYYGQLGDGTTTDKTTAVEVPGLTNVLSVAAGPYHSLALKSDGTVWAWGYNSSGQLGNGSQNNSLVPVQVKNLSGIIKISANANSMSSYALKSDGTVWAWGENSTRQLGDGTGWNRTTPVQVEGLSGVSDIIAGWGHAYALTSTGTVWGWGSVVNNNMPGWSFPDWYTFRYIAASPLTGLTNIAGIATSEGSLQNNYGIALKKDGSVAVWGGSYATLTPVNGLSQIQGIAGGSSNYAIAEDGSVWNWTNGAPV
ncbi:Ig domain-containing protein, partial [Paenibacillus sp. FSL R7-269]|uniref:OmpL47-type beta-barrel domain-containing protein n=3 Tax=unclassified Paenibacillus TaxID=185978 RepID=UPI0003E26E4E